MRSDEFYKFGQSIGGALQGMFGGNGFQSPLLGGFSGQGNPQSTFMDQPPNRYGIDYDLTDRIVDQYTRAGYSPEFAIGMAANAAAKGDGSSLNDSGGYGVFNWKNDRMDGLEAFSDRNGKTVDDLNNQIAFSLQELGTTQKAAFDMVMQGNPQSAAEYAALIDQHYQGNEQRAMGNVEGMAADLYKRYFGQNDNKLAVQGDASQYMTVDYSGATHGMNQNTLDAVREAAHVVFGNDLADLQIGSGADGHSRNHQGSAMDLGIVLKDGTRVPWDDPRMKAFTLEATRRGVRQIGLGPTYMGGNNIHIGVGTPGYDSEGRVRYWNDDGGPGDYARGVGTWADELQAAVNDPIALGSIAAASPYDLAGRAGKGAGEVVSPDYFRGDTDYGRDAGIKNKPGGGASSMLSLIRDAEASGSYNTVIEGRTPPKPLTEMSLNEVRAYQSQLATNGAESSAVGGYQFIGSTLQGLMDEMGLSGDEMFTPELQDRLATRLMERRGLNDYLNGNITRDQFADNLAMEWAALPTASGQSYYAGVGSNRALVGRGAVDAALQDTTAESKAPPGSIEHPGDKNQPGQNDPYAYLFGDIGMARDPNASEMQGRDQVDNDVAFANQPARTRVSTSGGAGGGMGMPPAGSGQSPSGGYDPSSSYTGFSGAPTMADIGTSSQAAGDGKLGGFQQIFTRREGESDASLADRRRAMFLNAAEGFQMLSRGVKADFNTPVQMRLDERQRRIDNRFRDIEQVRDQSNSDRNYELAARQEDRLERSLQLEQTKMMMDEAARVADQERDAAMRQGLVDFYTEKGKDDLAALAANGQATLAGQIYQDSIAGSSGAPLGAGTVQAAVRRAEEMNRADLAAAAADGANPKLQVEAIKEIFDLDGSESVEDIKARGAQLRQIIPTTGISADQVASLEAAADAVAATGDTDRYTQFFDLLKSYVDNGNPQNAIFDQYMTDRATQFTEEMNGVNSVANAGRNQMAIATNPEFNPNQLKGQFLNPITRLLRGVPGGEEFADSVLGVDDADVYGKMLLEGIRSGQIGSLAAGMNGALTERESEWLMAQLGDGTMERTEILALGQMMVKKREIKIAGQEAVDRYVAETRAAGEQPTMAGAERARAEAEASVEVFRKFTSQEEIDAEALRIAGDRDPRYLPPDQLGEVVTLMKPDGSVELVPLFYAAVTRADE